MTGFNNINLNFCGPDSVLHGRVCSGYEKMFRTYKTEKFWNIISAVATLIVIAAICVLEGRSKGASVIIMIFIGLVVFGIIVPSTVGWFMAKRNYDRVVNGSYQLAGINLIDVFYQRNGGRSKNVCKYFIEVCDEGGIRAKIRVSKENYDFAKGHLGSIVALVRPVNGKGIYDECDYCPGLYEQSTQFSQMNSGILNDPPKMVHRSTE